MRIIVEADFGELNASVFFHIDSPIAVDHDFRNVRVGQEGLQRAQTHDFVFEVSYQSRSFLLIEGECVFFDESRKQNSQLIAQLLGTQALDGVEVNPGEELLVQLLFSCIKVQSRVGFSLSCQWWCLRSRRLNSM